MARAGTNLRTSYLESNEMLPRPYQKLLIVLILATALVLPFGSSDYFMHLINLCFLACIGALGLMILTGFSLYAEHAPGGIMHKSLGFMYALFSNQGMRLAHHASMWLIFGFVINHIYSAWLMDIKEHGSEISSMFSGYKSVEED